MAGNGYNRLPNLPATFYTGETPPPVHITGYIGSRAKPLWERESKPGISYIYSPGPIYRHRVSPESFLRCSRFYVTPNSGCDTTICCWHLFVSPDMKFDFVVVNYGSSIAMVLSSSVHGIILLGINLRYYIFNYLYIRLLYYSSPSVLQPFVLRPPFIIRPLHLVLKCHSLC